MLPTPQQLAILRPGRNPNAPLSIQEIQFLGGSGSGYDNGRQQRLPGNGRALVMVPAKQPMLQNDFAPSGGILKVPSSFDPSIGARLDALENMLGRAFGPGSNWYDSPTVRPGDFNQGRMAQPEGGSEYIGGYVTSDSVTVPGNAAQGDTFDCDFTGVNLARLSLQQLCELAGYASTGQLLSEPSKAIVDLLVNDEKVNAVRRVPLMRLVPNLFGQPQVFTPRFRLPAVSSVTVRITLLSNLSGATPADDCPIYFGAIGGEC